MEKESQFLVSQQLGFMIRQCARSYKVADAITDNCHYMNGLGYTIFDISPSGHIIASDGRKVTNIGIYKWARELLKGTLYANDMGVNESIFEYYNIKDSDIEKFGNYINGMAKKNDFQIKLISGKAIKNMFTDFEGSGRLAKSCMNGKGNYFSMLADCESLKMLVILDIDKIIGRAFVWNVDVGSGNNITFLDRFYTSRDYLDGVLIEYAKSNGWWRKYQYDSFEKPKLWVSPTGNIANITGTVTVKKRGYVKYPYLDTFYYGGDGFLSNSPYNCDTMFQRLDGKCDRTII